MLVYMHALHAVGELDRRRLHTRGLRRAMAAGTQALATLLGGFQDLSMALALHVRGLTYALSLGQPVWLKTLCGGQGERAPFGRQGRHVHAQVFATGDLEGWGEPVPAWSMVEIGVDARPHIVSLV